MATLCLPDLERALNALSLGGPVPSFAEADVLGNPLDVCRSYLAGLLCDLIDCDPKVAYNSIQWPNNIDAGDLAIILPKLYPGVKPDEAAIDLMAKFPKEHPLFPLPVHESVHLRFFLKTETFARLLLPYILDRKSSYGTDPALGMRDASSPEGARKKLVVEFSSPNITSELQGKHLRSTVLGAFVSRLYENMGWGVTRINYLGDWGKPIALLQVGFNKYGDEEAYRADPVGHLLHVYHQIEEEFLPLQAASRKARDEAAKTGQDEGEAQLEIESHGLFAERNAAFKKLEEGDEEAVAFWKRARDANIESYTDFYARLGIKFDKYTGESQVSPDTMTEVEQMLKDKGICEESGGAWIIHMQKCGLRAGTAIIRDRTGASTYLLRDLAAVFERSREFEFDKMIYVVANDNNSNHFTQLFKILEAIGMKELAEKLHQAKFSDVSKMAEKLGKGYKPQAILNHCEEAMLNALKADEEKATPFGVPGEAAKALSVSALLGQELSTRSVTAHAFDTTTMTLFKPGTTLDLQYWYAKLCSLLKEQPGTVELSEDDYDAILLDEPNKDEPTNLLRILAQYPEVTHVTYHSLEPAAIMTYLASVVQQLEDCVDDNEGDKEEGDAEEAKPEKPDASITLAHAVLYEAARIVLENGMKLLGLTPFAKYEPDRADTPVAE